MNRRREPWGCRALVTGLKLFLTSVGVVLVERAMKDWTPMTPLDKRAACALGCCTFLPGAPAKGFAQEMAAKARHCEPTITEKQRAWLWQLVFTYRRQILDAEVVERAAKLRERK